MKVKSDPQDLVTKIHLDIKLGGLKIELGDTMKKYRNDVLNSLDKVVKELEAAREDRIISNHKLDQIQEIVQEQGSRLSDLEQQQIN